MEDRRPSWAWMLAYLVVAWFGSAMVLAEARSDDSGKPERATDAYYSANGLLNRGLFDLAIKEYDDFLAAHSGHEKAESARYGRAVCLFQTKQYAPAAEALAQLAALGDEGPYAAQVKLMLGRSCLALKRYDAAVKAFEPAEDEDTGGELADDMAAGLVESLTLQGDHDRAAKVGGPFETLYPTSEFKNRVALLTAQSEIAISAYEPAARRLEGLIARDPDGPYTDQSRLLVGRCFQLSGSWQEAIRAYEGTIKAASDSVAPDALLGLGLVHLAQDHHSQASTALEALLKRFPKSGLAGRASLELGHARVAQKQWDKAFEAFSRAGSLDETLENQSDYWRAKCRLLAGQNDQAADLFAEALERQSDGAFAAAMLYDQSVALVRAGRGDQSIPLLEAFGRRFGTHELAPQALVLLATAHHGRHNYEASAKACDAFVRAFPSNPLRPEVAFLAAENAYLAERFDEAATRYRDYLSDFPTGVDADKAGFRLGSILYGQKKLDEAKPLLEASVARDRPEFATAMAALGDLHFQHSEWKQAIEHFKRFVAEHPKSGSLDDALIKLGLSHQRLNQWDAAVGIYERLLRTFPKSRHRVQAMFESGQALDAAGKTNEARRAFQGVVEESPKNRFTGYAWQRLGDLALREGDHMAAARCFDQVGDSGSDAALSAQGAFQKCQALLGAGSFEAAATALSTFIERFTGDPQVPTATAQLAIARARSGSCEASLKAVARVEQEFAANVAPDLLATALYEGAWCLGSVGKSEQAAAVYIRMLKQGAAESLRPRAGVELASILEQAERFDEAAEWLRPVVAGFDAQTPPDEAVARQAQYLLGICAFRLERFAEAAKVLDQLLESCSRCAFAASSAFYCGEAYRRLGKDSAAVARFERVVKSHGEHELYAPSLLALGETHASLQQWIKSEQVLTRFLNQFADHKNWYEARFGLGWAREHRQRYDDAISAYRQVVSKHRGETAARAQFQIGECLFAKKAYEDAVRELLKVEILFAYPSWSAAALFEAGRCFEALGRRVDARAQYEKIVKDYASTEWARTASARLKIAPEVTVPGRATR